jgi:hypothetical protein
MVEGIAGFFGGDDVPIPIVEGTVSGDHVAFKSGDSNFTGAIKGDRIELQRSLNLPWETPKPPPGDRACTRWIGSFH